MESIKRFFSSCTKSIEKSKSKGHPQISLPVEGSFKQLTTDIGLATQCPAQISSSPRQDSGYHQNISPTISFTPQGRGRKETIDWLDTGTCESLTSLLTERDKASRQIKLGPNTKGMKEVQQILKGPSCHAVKQLQSLKRETEIAVRYGCPGVIMYNFSKTLGWNQASSSQLPSLQLRSFRTTKEEIQLASASISPLPFSPITWLVLPQQPAPVQLPSMNDDGDGMQEKRPSSPISEPGGWRDTDQIEDIADMRLEPFLGIAVSARNVAITDDDDEEDEDLEGEFCPHEDDVVSTACEKQAIPVKIIPVFSGQVRQVRIRNIK